MYACNRPVHLMKRNFATVRRGEFRSIFKAYSIAERDLLTEAAWPKRLVIREIRARDSANDDGGELHRDIHRPREARGPKGHCKPVYVRFRDEDRLLLDARAAARGMRPATYVSVLTRSKGQTLPRRVRVEP
jgi:hypothetical protein